jgi:hypothetical protein
MTDAPTAARAVGPVGHVGRHAPRTLGCLTAAADRPHITASVDQLGRDGAADGACCADNYVQGIIRSIIVMLRLLAPIVPGAESPRSLLSVRSATDHMPERGLVPINRTAINSFALVTPADLFD